MIKKNKQLLLFNDLLYFSQEGVFFIYVTLFHETSLSQLTISTRDRTRHWWLIRVIFTFLQVAMILCFRNCIKLSKTCFKCSCTEVKDANVMQND